MQGEDGVVQILVSLAQLGQAHLDGVVIGGGRLVGHGLAFRASSEGTSGEIAYQIAKVSKIGRRVSRTGIGAEVKR